jgi:hypothetical protein
MKLTCDIGAGGAGSSGKGLGAPGGAPGGSPGGSPGKSPGGSGGGAGGGTPPSKGGMPGKGSARRFAV